MKRVVLAVALFSVFSVLSPVTASALPVGTGWGSKRDAIVEKIITQNGLGTREKQILNKIVVPERNNLFSYKADRFQIQEKYRSILLALGLHNACRNLDPREYSGQQWMSCSIN
ncbi:hypothetical protein HNQ69_001303 [Bartonella callosciuri]|uniref:Uncharacterized protein n=1 Tax=Bartonella callosciuri TaxID=686223 RepID=A0A840NN75_9HYPH|nr:hypothetical protein [Bartonella callosciuri]MBB5074166.1 hypothetical protein [Bartonella callosciuri]